MAEIALTYPTYEPVVEPHGWSPENDRCRCGGEWVYFEDAETHGCEAAGPPPGDLVLDAYGRSETFRRVV